MALTGETELPRQIVVPLEDSSGVGEARRRAAAFARLLALDATASGHVALAVTEAASNIVKHAGQGEIALRALRGAKMSGLELLAIDKGPGIASLSLSMQDGHSTSGSPGTGLGALLRTTTNFEIYTQLGGGTALRAEVWAGRPAKPPTEALLVGALAVPMRGEPVCGDDWAVCAGRGRLTALVVDGLGHGADAAAAAHAAVEVVHAHPQLGAAALMEQIHNALRPTRGAAAAVAVLNAAMGVCTYCGVGNISATLHAGGKARSMVSHNGILGHQVRKMVEFTYPLQDHALCILHSDGLSARWSLERYPGLASRHPALVAAVLYRDFRRVRDDATVLALRHAGRGS
jgi:anti-sigma regulatory factor (Ser/Thr protein kinase)